MKLKDMGSQKSSLIVSVLSLVVSIAVLLVTVFHPFSGFLGASFYSTSINNIGNVNFRAVTGSFADATTTPFCFQNPFVATSTVIQWTYDVTGVSTTTIDHKISTSTSQFPSNLLASAFMASTTISTNTLAYETPGVGFDTVVSPNSRVVVGPNEYVCDMVGNALGLGSTVGVTNASNTFAGSYSFLFIR